MNSQREGARLKKEAKDLESEPFKVPGTLIFIHFEGFPTLVDGKTKCLWSGSKAFSRCYVCGASSKDLRHRHSTKFRPINLQLLTYGFSSLHVKLRAFDWFCKAYLNKDFKSHEARYAFKT